MEKFDFYYYGHVFSFDVPSSLNFNSSLEGVNLELSLSRKISLLSLKLLYKLDEFIDGLGLIKDSNRYSYLHRKIREFYKI